MPCSQVDLCIRKDVLHHAARVPDTRLWCAAHILGHVEPRLHPLPSEAQLAMLPARQRPVPRAYFELPFDWRYQVL